VFSRLDPKRRSYLKDVLIKDEKIVPFLLGGGRIFICGSFVMGKSVM